MKKVLIIALNFPPGAAGVSIMRAVKFTKYLPEFGYQPYVLTVDRKSTESESEIMNEIKHAKIYTTKSMKMFDMEKNIRLSLGETKTKAKNTAQKAKLSKTIEAVAKYIESFLFVPDRKILWNKRAFKKACEIIESEKIENVFITSPPNSTLMVGVKLKKKYPHLNLISDLRDGWTSWINCKSATPVHRLINLAMEKKMAKYSNSIVTVTPPVTGYLKDLYGNPNTFTIYNGFDTEDVVKNQTQTKNSKFSIVYLGSLRDFQTGKMFYQALGELLKEKPDLRNKISVDFYGRLSPSEIGYFETYGIGEVAKYRGFVPHNVGMQKLTEADALLLILIKEGNSNTIIPAKLFEYLSVQKQILSIIPDGPAKDIIEELEAGQIADPKNISGIKKAILSMYSKWENGKLSANIPYEKIAKYDRKNLTKKLSLLLDKDYSAFKKYNSEE